MLRVQQYCGDKFSVEPVDVTYDDTGDKQTTPLMSTRTEEALVSEICSIIGVKVSRLLHNVRALPSIYTSSDYIAYCFNRCISVVLVAHQTYR